MSEAPAPTPAADSTTAELVNLRNAHTRVWEVAREVQTTLPDGRTGLETVKSRICEKASGLCYKDGAGEWVPSVPEWRETPDGFVIDRSAYGLFVGKTIGTGVRYTIYGQDVTFRPARLVVSDGADEAQLATVSADSQGFIVPGSASVLRFANAFGPGYDLEYVAEKDGFHQNLVMWAAPSAPPGMAADSCEFEIWTEVGLDSYLSAADAEVIVGLDRAPGIDGLAGVRVTPGTPIAFALKADTEAEPDAIADDPFWLLADSEVWDSSDPPSPGSRSAAVKEIRRDPETGTVYLIETLPLGYFAAAAYPVIWDWVVKSGTIGSGVTEEWTPNKTYYVSGTLSIYGRVTILPGTVVKLAPNTYINIIGTQPFTAKGDPWNYVVFTNAKDDTCGERIDTAQTGRYATAVVLYSSSSAASVVQYCKFGHGTTGIAVNKALTSPIANNIVRDMTYAGISLSQQTHCRNNLLVGTGTGAGSGVRLTSPAGYLDVKNNTIDSWQYGVYSYGCYGITAKYNVVTRTYTGMYSNNAYLYIQYNGFWTYTVRTSGGTYGAGNVDLGNTPGSTPFDPSPVGDFFLNDNDPGGENFKDAGDVQASQVGLASAEFAVVKPNVAPQSVTQNIYWAPIDHDSGNLDLGYHHNRVDWVLDGADTLVTNSGLILVPGLVVAINGQGRTLRVGTEGKIISLGDPYERRPDIIASKRSVSMGIESSLKLSPVYGQNDGQVGVTLSADSIFDSRIRHTIFRGLAWGIKAERWCVFPIKNCRFDQNIIGMESYGGTVSAINNVFAWNETGIGAALPTGARAEFRNNTFDGNWWEGLHLNTVSGSTAIIKDNLFTSNNCGIQVYGAGDVQYGHNGFYGNTTHEPQPYPKEGDVFLASSPYYKQGVITKRWFLDQSTALKNGGSTTTVAAKLLPYVTAYSQSYDVGLIDIGYHAFTSTGPSNPDPDSPTLTISRVRDEFGYEPPDWPLQGMIDVTVETVDAESYSTETVQLYVDGEFVTTVQPLTGAEHGANTCVFPSYREVNTYDPVYLSDWGHTLQAVAESTKPAVGRSDPVTVDTLFWAHCVSLSGRELELDGSHTLECSGLLYDPYQAGVGVSALHGGWGTIWDDFPYSPSPPESVDPSYPGTWAETPVRQLGPRPEAYLFHETWDGRDGENNLVPDSVYTFQLFIDILGDAPVFWEQVSAFSTPITEAEVAIFLPVNTLWDGFSAQAVVNACWGLGLSYRILVDQSANWDNLKTFLTCERPSGRYPCVLYVRGHGDWQETYDGQQYQVTCFVLSDADVYATTSPGVDFGGDLPWSFVSEDNFTKRHFISDPLWDTGLKDPRYYGQKELSETDWVKFVWVDACYSQLDSGYWGGGMSDMSIALGMACNDEHDQSYIGFGGLTPNNFYDQWASSVYTWLFWYYLSVASGVEPDCPVELAKYNASVRITEWLTDDYIRWFALVVAYMGEINTISDPALDARVKDHIGEQ